MSSELKKAVEKRVPFLRRWLRDNNFKVENLVVNEIKGGVHLSVSVFRTPQEALVYAKSVTVKIEKADEIPACIDILKSRLTQPTSPEFLLLAKARTRNGTRDVLISEIPGDEASEIIAELFAQGLDFDGVVRHLQQREVNPELLRWLKDNYGKK